MESIMLGLSGFKLYSLAFGAKYVRTFLIHDVRGIIADHVLGECGAPKSPLPADFFTKVTMADNAVELTNDDRTCKFSVSPDKVVYLQRTASSSANFEESEIGMGVGLFAIGGVCPIADGAGRDLPSRAADNDPTVTGCMRRPSNLHPKEP